MIAAPQPRRVTSPAFSARDLSRLEHALRVLLHPTADSPVGWLLDVTEVMRDLGEISRHLGALKGVTGSWLRNERYAALRHRLEDAHAAAEAALVEARRRVRLDDQER